MGTANFCHRIWTLQVLIMVMSLFPSCAAQQAGEIDLTQITRSMGLRRPPARAREPLDHRGITTYNHVCSAEQIRPDLETTLTGLDRSEYRSGDVPKFEVRITNIGSSSVQIPFSPHLAELQPADAGMKFAYSELKVELWIGGMNWKWSTNAGGGVTLYGSDAHAGTMLTLQPGQWAKIIGEGQPLPEHILPAAGLARDSVTAMNAQISIYQDETLITSWDSATSANEFCLNQKRGSNIPVKISEPE